MKFRKLSKQDIIKAYVISTCTNNYNPCDDISIIECSRNKKDVNFKDIEKTVHAMFRLTALLKGIKDISKDLK